MNAGVLIIGSLLWDPARANWRNRLRLADAVPVHVPIRYGRISLSRHNTYTIVLCSKSKATPGIGYVVPFVNPINSIPQLHDEVVELLSAERNERHTNPRYNIGFCVAALAINPQYQEYRSGLVAHWNSHMSEGFEPNDYRIGDEDPIVDKGGILQIDWPAEINHFDFIIATATKPTLPAYPIPQEIAQRMNENEYWDYFLRNRENGIITYEDINIAQYLSGSAHTD